MLSMLEAFGLNVTPSCAEDCVGRRVGAFSDETFDLGEETRGEGDGVIAIVVGVWT
jgi:hypothetical protein